MIFYGCDILVPKAKTNTKRSTTTDKKTKTSPKTKTSIKKDAYPAKSDMILKLANMEDSINIKVIEIIAKKNKCAVKEDKFLKILQSLNSEALKDTYDTFILNKSDRTGRHFEYRSLNYYLTTFLKNCGEGAEDQITDVKLHKTMIKDSEANINFDFVIEYNGGTEIDIIECKDRAKEIDQDIVHDFLENCRGTDAATHSSGDVQNIFLFSRSGFTTRALDSVKSKAGPKGHWEHGDFSFSNFIATKSLQKDWVNIYFVGELNDRLTQIYPSLR